MIGRRVLRCGAPGAAFVACLGVAPRARADLRGEAARLAASWQLEGQKVWRPAPAFVEHGRLKLYQIEPNGPGADVAASKTGCTTVAFLGVRTADFSIEPERALLVPRGEDSPDEDKRTRSASGVAWLGRCGAEQADLRRIVVDVASSRGAIEVVVAQGERGPLNVPEVLPERAAGPLSPRGDPGAPIDPGPLTARIARARARAENDGAAEVTRVETTATENGTGTFELRLAAGCHRLEVFSDVPARLPHRPVDVDAEARDVASGRVLARDRADVPDARLDFCVGDKTRVDVPFVGAAERHGVTLSDALFRIPARVPVAFGTRARAGLAWALYRRHAAAPIDAPVAASVGVQGVTVVPIEVEPGRCYLAAVALTKGDARALRISVEVDGRISHDEAAERADGASAAFCAGTSRRARVEIEARGNTPWWTLAIWPAGATPP